MSDNAKKVAKEVATKEVKKFDYKAFAESIEAAFKSDKTADVIADSNIKAGPKNTTLADYRYVHFYKPNTEKDIFGMYLIGHEQTRFALNLKVEEFLDAGLNIKPVEKKVKGSDTKRKVAIDVICDNKDAVAVAKKILTAYSKIKPVEKKPVEKKPAAPKAEKKATEKKPAPKKQTTKATEKKVAEAK